MVEEKAQAFFFSWQNYSQGGEDGKSKDHWAKFKWLDSQAARRADRQTGQ